MSIQELRSAVSNGRPINLFKKDDDDDSEEDGSSRCNSKITADGDAYYMDKSARARFNDPECTQICTYTTKQLRSGGLCPKKAIYLHSKRDVPLEFYCQQHFTSFSRRGGFEKEYRKRDRMYIHTQLFQKADSEDIDDELADISEDGGPIDFEKI